jgi:hypothetical protein
MRPFHDPPCMPGSRQAPADRWAVAVPLAGTPGQAYVERRGVPVHVAHAAGVRFDPDFGGRPAVLVAMCDRDGTLLAVHGRYLHTVRGQLKMLTVGQLGGMVGVGAGWRAEPLLVVEGLFDALSLATCERSGMATIGRWAPWLPEVSAGRVVWLAFDDSRSGRADAVRYAARLHEAEVRCLPPPPRCKDWSTALVKHGPGAVRRWIDGRLAAGGTSNR